MRQTISHSSRPTTERRDVPERAPFTVVATEGHTYPRQMSTRDVLARVLAVRARTTRLAEPLEIEDWVVQSMPDASPVKWHLAHTTWFFERFVLRTLGIPPVSDAYEFLFNSYYDSVGERHPRAKRGLLTRPTAREVLAYRAAVDARLADLAGSPRLDELAPALELGANHEEQHQELLLTDVKHLLAQNPLAPAYRTSPATPGASVAPELAWSTFEGGLVAIGHEGEGFAFDNEAPRHRVWLEPYALASRLVTAGEYLAFVEDGGYRRPELWLSEGWSWAQERRAPLYWDLDARTHFTLHGRRDLRLEEPVTHVTYYESDAYARWAGARLPREAEWENALVHGRPTTGALLEDDALHPSVAVGTGLQQMVGDAWEWTASAYEPYPGFAPLAGAFGEYNGKFMVSQMVLRGASCVTPRDHARATYRNFFPPGAAWQFTGIRLARDCPTTTRNP